jgi:hypothetical protein
MIAIIDKNGEEHGIIYIFFFLFFLERHSNVRNAVLLPLTSHIYKF